MVTTKVKPKDFTDMIIWLSECLEDVEGISIEWRVLNKYCTDFLFDNDLKCIIETDKELKRSKKENGY